MLKVIRRGVFETNSSSTHSITLCSKEDYDKWDKGEVLLDNSWRAEEQFITREEAIKRLKNNKYNEEVDFTDEETVNELLRDSDLYTSEEYFDDECLESFEDTYITKGGETVVAFGKYGMDN